MVEYLYFVSNDLVEHDSSTHYDLDNKHIVKTSSFWQFQQIMRNYNFVNVCCPDVPIKVTSECILHNIQ